MADLTNKDKPTLTALHQQERRIEAQLAQAAQAATNTAVQTAQHIDNLTTAQTALSQRLRRIERTLDRLTAVEKRNLGLDQRMKDLGFRLTDGIGENRRERGALTSRVKSLEGAYEWVKHRLNEEQAGDAKRLDALHTAVSALQNAPPPDVAPLKSQLSDLTTAVSLLTARLADLSHDTDNLHDTQLQHAARHEAMSDVQDALGERVQEHHDAMGKHLAHVREEQSALEHAQAQHTGRLDLLAQGQITAEHDIERTRALAHRALIRPGTLAAPLIIPAHLQDTAVSIAPHAGQIRQFQPAQFVRIGPAVGQLRDPATDEEGNEMWTFKVFTKQGTGATFTEGTAVELIGDRAQATPHFD